MQQTKIERVQEQARLGGDGNPLGIMQAIQIWSY